MVHLSTSSLPKSRGRGCAEVERSSTPLQGPTLVIDAEKLYYYGLATQRTSYQALADLQHPARPALALD